MKQRPYDRTTVGKKFLAGLAAGALASFACWANTDIWLTAADNTNAWPGTQSQPLSASTTDKLDAILGTNNLNCTFHYAPGVYLTTGYQWAGLGGGRQTANPGCKHLGAGVGQTIIRLVGVQPDAQGRIFGADTGDETPFVPPSDGFEVHDMTLDCNAVGNSNYWVRGVISAAVHPGGGGSGYTTNDTLTVTGGEWRAAKLAVTGVDASGAITNVQVVDAGGYTNDPPTNGNVVTGGSGSGATMDLTMRQNGRVCMAVVTAGSNITLSNLDILGFGTGGAEEGWAVLIGPGGQKYLTRYHETNFDNVVITGCHFSAPAPTNYNNLNCCSLVASTGFTVSNNVIVSCTASNIDGPGTPSCTAFYATLVTNCIVDGCFMGTYFETGWNDDTNRDFILCNNLYRNVSRGAFIQFRPYDIRSISFISNTFEPYCGGSAFWSAESPGANATLYWFVAYGNRVFIDDTNCNSGELGFQVWNMNHALVQDNVITLNSGRGLPRNNPAASRWYSGNVDANGQPLLVAVNNNGIYTNVSQASECVWLEPLPPLINIDFGAGRTNSAKAGFAATGTATTDFWNYYSRDDGQGGYKYSAWLPNLGFANGAVSSAGLTINNLPGAYSDGSLDPMYNVYDYPFGGTATLTLTNLVPGLYNFYLYSPDGNYRLTVDNTDYGTRTCQDVAGSNPPIWQEGVQYSRFRDVVVNTNQTVTITVYPGVGGYALISGMQIQPAPVQPPAAPAGLAGWWRMEGNAHDSSPWGNNGSLTGAYSFVTGAVGQGMMLSNKPAGFSVPNSSSLNFGPYADFSIEGWIKPQTATTSYGVENIADKTNANDPSLYNLSGYEFSVVYGQLNFMMVSYQSSTRLGTGGGPDLRDGRWHHVAVSVQRGSTNGAQLYVDGVVVASFDPTPLAAKDLSTTVPLLIGMHPSYWLDCNFRGGLDEISLYRRALSAGEIQAIYHAGALGKCPPAPIPTNLVSWWKVEGNALDSGPAANSGSLTGAYSFVTGEVGQGIMLSNKPAGFSVANSSSLNFGPYADFSIEGWIQPKVATTSYGVENIADKTNAKDPSLYQLSGYEFSVVYGQLNFMMVSYQSSTRLGAGGGPDLRDGRWHHVAVSVQRGSSTGGQLYVDGMPVATFDPTPLKANDLSTTVPLLIGMHPSYWLDCNFRGGLDEISLYNRALAPAELQAIYRAGYLGKRAP